MSALLGLGHGAGAGERGGPKLGSKVDEVESLPIIFGPGGTGAVEEGEVGVRCKVRSCSCGMR